jgi:serine/threonine protein kinase
VLATGTMLRNYELISVLGQGGFGITYHARDTQLERDVAIKEYLPISIAVRENGIVVLPRSTELTEEFIWGRERFLDEARTLAKLSRAPAIVRVHDFLEANGTAYMIMALAQGKTLEQRLKSDGPFPHLVIERLLYPLLDGLEQVHTAGFLHRDIKPANIILDVNEDPTLIDFGASRAAMAGRSSALTAIFTPGYAAAEQFTSAKQGPWTDIYGLSATLYHAITGKVPPSAFDRMLDDAYEPLRRLRPVGFSPGLLAGIDAGLSVRASDRPQSIAGWRLILGRDDIGSSEHETTEVLHQPKVAQLTKAPRNGYAPSPPKTQLQPSQEVAPSSTQTSNSSFAQRKPQFLWAGVAAAVVTVAGAGYFMFVPSKSAFVGTVVQSLTAVQLEQALAERRKADAAAKEKKRLEEEAQHQADADANTKQAADAELAIAQEQRHKAEEELSKLKSEIEARRQEEVVQREQAAAAANRALEEAAKRNKAESEISALRRVENEAKQKAAATATAKQQADEVAQSRAEAETAALRQAEEEARQKATAEAEAKRQADEALAKAQAERQRADEEATRQKIELDARQKADADEKARRDADAKEKPAVEAKARAEVDAAAEKKSAEAAELALRLSMTDRQHIQVALMSLGFDTRGSDGIFGPRSREMISAWQTARGQPSKGYLTAGQQQALLREGAQAVRRFDEEQQKVEEQKKKAEDEARARIAAATSTGTPIDPRSFDGPWKRDRAAKCQQAPDNVSFNGLTVRDGRFSYTSIGEHHQETCTVQINPDGSFKNHMCLLQMEGRFSGELLELSYLSPSYGPCTVSAHRGE